MGQAKERSRPLEGDNVSFRDRDRRDFASGLMFIGIGAFFAIGAQSYPMGSAVRMGPAYFPTVLGWMLIVLGLIVFVRSFFLPGAPLPRINWRPLVFVLGSVFTFSLLLEVAGLAVTSLVLMIICAIGGWDLRWKEQFINAVLLTALNVGLFYYGLGLPFRLWPWS
jgi:putative tricarboxylic transport membrane protein